MTDTTAAPAPSAGGLSLDQGAAAISELDRGPERGGDRGQPRDEAGRYTREELAQQKRDREARGEVDDDEDEFDPTYDAGDGEDLDDEDAALDAEDGADEEADPDGEEEETREQKFKVRINGQDMEVPASELVAGYQRGKDYSNKMTALANERRSFETVATATLAERNAYTQLLSQVGQFLMEQAPSEDAINQLMMDDPVEGFRAKQIRDQVMGKANEFRDAYAAMVQGGQRETVQSRQQEMAAAHAALPQLIPEWKDPQRHVTEAAAIGRAMTESWGFKPEELNDITDPRAMLIARKAWLYDQLVARKGERLKGVKPARTDGQRPPGQRPNGASQRQPERRPPPANRPGMSPGSRQTNTPQGQNRRQLEATQARARQSGSLEDVAALIKMTEY